MEIKFPSDWEIYPLENCMDAIIDYRGKTPQKTSMGIPLITAKIVKNGRIQPVSEYIDPKNYDKWMRRGLPKCKDVIMTTEAPLGEIAQLDNKKVALAQRLITLRGKKGFLDNDFLNFLMQSNFVQHQLIARATGTTVLGIKQSELRKISLVIPPLDEQKAIAHILGTFDDKIELNQQMNRTLEAIARAIFKSWFIDFDPVRAKMDGRQPVGMDAETAALFPDEFEDSPLGQIPKGWKLDCIGNHVKIIKGRSYKSSELIPSDTALVTLKSIQRGGGYSQNGLKPYSGIYKSDQIIKPGELVVAYTDITQAADVIGKPAIVRRTSHFKTLVASLDLGIVRPVNEVLSIPFLYCLFMTDDFQSHVYGHTNGSTVLHLGKDGIPAYSFLIPNQSIISCFSYYAAPVFEKLEINEIQMYSLQSLRDTLLPKLLSGEIRVKDAEKIVEEVV
ncbi:restriction endonuclease subunit S [Limnospira fusiformis]|uniref:restriction endonuclease subunit S n=1 Tax=Limnospira fusiformis TaxID=54297 RepID=UPI0014492A5C|nr:restriction endonuclease subunit S [Limnospira fusiformis SAG 85.79]